MVAPGGACMVAPGGIHGCSRGMCVVAQGACMVAPGGHAWLLQGVCMVAQRGMDGCSQGGGCMVAPRGHAWLLWGACMGYNKIWRYNQLAGGTHPTGMHSCFMWFY